VGFSGGVEGGGEEEKLDAIVAMKVVLMGEVEDDDNGSTHINRTPRRKSDRQRKNICQILIVLLPKKHVI
jgi:hypothetical protein